MGIQVSVFGVLVCWLPNNLDLINTIFTTIALGFQLAGSPSFTREYTYRGQAFLKISATIVSAICIRISRYLHLPIYWQFTIRQISSKCAIAPQCDFRYCVTISVFVWFLLLTFIRVIDINHPDLTGHYVAVYFRRSYRYATLEFYNAGGNLIY